MASVVKWVRSLWPLPMVRIYSLLYMALFATLSLALALTDGQEFGRHPVPPVEIIFIVGFGFVALIKFISFLVDQEWMYKLAYTMAMAVMSSWAFTMYVYAAFGLVAWTRGIIITFVIVENSMMLPYLLNARKIADTIADTTHDLHNGER